MIRPGVHSPGAGDAVSEDTIFVSIAAYRDPELLPTIEDCLAKAQWPDRLRFGICWQHGPEEVPLARSGDPRFRILDVDWRESRGACWARAQIMKLWEGERWFLQLDSHHRFVQGWDVKLLKQAAATGSPKPILTAYAGPYVPDDPGSFTEEPMQMEFDRFTEDGLVLFRPGAIPDWRTKTDPRRSRFVSAHFLFAPGDFVSDVPYDPSLYFIGEEITLTVRAFTHGYDLYHPGEVILWHEYTRNYRSKHWDDHTADRGAAVDWAERDVPSREKARRLLTEPRPGQFGLGTERSLADYEAFAGISFAHRRAQDYTRHHLEPPNPPADDDDWAVRTKDHTVRITMPASKLTSLAWTDAQFWYVGIHDGADEEIFRADADRDEIACLQSGEPEYIMLVRQFESTAWPARWTIQPWTAAEGWLDPIEGELAGDGSGLWETAPAVAAVATAPTQRDELASMPGEDADLSGLYPKVMPGLWFTQIEGGFTVTQAGASVRLVINNTGVLVLELANGRHSVAEIISIVQEAFGLASPPRTQVTAFLDSASRSRLIGSEWLGEKDGHGRQS
jgi:Glycosyltransferase (GlcNAc)